MRQFLFSVLLITASISVSSAQVVDSYYKSIQPKDNSPLSRLGFGNILPQNYISNAGMGGLTAAFRDPLNFNPFNPASLPALRTASFEVGLYGKNTNVTDNQGNTGSGASGNLSYIGLGFPMYSVINEVLDRAPRQLRWAAGLSLTPYNQVGYNVNTTGPAPNTDSVTVTNYFLGSGGTYKLMISNGVQYKDFSVGANIGVVFGEMNYIKQTDLSADLIYPYKNYFVDHYSMSGFIYNLGFQYDVELDKKNAEKLRGRKRLIIGAYGNGATPFTTTSGSLYRRTIPGFREDTLSSTSDIAGSGRLPSEIVAGISYKNGYAFQIGAEYKYTGWGNDYFNTVKQDLAIDRMLNASVVTLGMEFITDKSLFRSDDSKIRWRLGFHSGKDPRVLGGEQVNTWGASAGVCMPMKVGRGGQPGYVNFALEYGKLTTVKLSEEYFRLFAGFTLTDNTWFLKRKYQ